MARPKKEEKKTIKKTVVKEAKKEKVSKKEAKKTVLKIVGLKKETPKLKVSPEKKKVIKEKKEAVKIVKLLVNEQVVLKPQEKPAPIFKKTIPPIAVTLEPKKEPHVKTELKKPALKIEEIKKEHPKEIKKEIPLAKEKTTVEIKPVILKELKDIELELPITVKDLAVKLQEKPSLLIKKLMDMGLMVGINHALDNATTGKICEKYGYRIKEALSEEEAALKIHTQKDADSLLQFRSPIVTFMGHVDHGKTSLLDAIRKTKVAELEHGGITQHIGAYRVVLPHGEITFLDTPGHEAFSAMRARGASVTDIVVLVVAADDGIMPQTKEAIDHARAAGVSIIVAINKIDKPQANLDRVKKQLSELDLTAEDWGGKTIAVGVSAKTGEGIDNLLEMILLESQMLELKANPNKLAKGVVLEAQMSKGRGPVATLLIQGGTLHLNENIIVGQYYGKIRAMFNDRAQSVTEARPSFPVEVLGITGVPQAGEQFFAIADERTAKDLAFRRQEKEKQQQIKSIKRVSLEELHSQIAEGKIKELNIIIKADVQGSLEAIKDTLNKLNVQEIKIQVIHDGVGNINASDVILAAASNALILGFHVDADERAKELIAKESIDVKTYNVIYELASDIKAAVEGMLEPKLKKVFLGRVEVKKMFKLSKSGDVAGCIVTKGKINRTSMVSLVRNGEVVFEGKLSSLKRFKDDVRDVAEGFECGLTLSGFNDIREGDIIEAYEIEKILRKI
jgi:translation initiation factor IF-2